MSKNPSNLTLIILAVLLVIGPASYGQDLAPFATEFLNSLTPTLQQKASFPFDNSERFNWHFIPRERKGVTFHDMDDSQTKAALALIRASLSTQGEEKTKAIFELENVLRIVENRPENDTYRDPLNYYFSVFGDPRTDLPWGWRLEGHHISLNFSSQKGKIVSATPTFFGSNPGIVQVDLHRGRQVLEKERSMGFALLHSLDSSQLRTAVYTDKAPADILTSNNRNASLLSPTGISYNELTTPQKDMLEALIRHYLQNYDEETQRNMWNKIKSEGLDKLHFAWAGSQKNELGQPHYYRIQSPQFLIEYDNVQNDANHVHTVVRDLSNDFGEDVLGHHYIRDHSHVAFHP
nr:DUF3500 domain-containing protein [Cytophagales bacterium]